MSSGPNAAIHNFPSGVDIYYQPVDRFTYIAGEAHTIAASGSLGVFYLNHLPLQSGATNVLIPGFSEQVGGSPSSNFFVVTYSGASAGLVSFGSTPSWVGSGVSASYTSAGDVIKSVMFADLQTSVVSIENYIVSGNLTAGMIRASGGTMTGNLVMSGASILAATSGVDSLGSNALPFSGVSANGFFGPNLQLDPTSYINFNVVSGVAIKDSKVSLSGDNGIYLVTSGNSIYLYSNVSVSGNIVPTFNGFYNLGSATQSFGTLYVSNIVTPNGSGSFVHTSGDTMTGRLVMSGVPLVTDQINSNTGSISINGGVVNLTSTSNVNLTPSPIGQVNLGAAVSVGQYSVNTAVPVLPSTPDSIDLGASGNNFRTLYVDNIVGATLSGAFVRSSGDTMTGSLTIAGPNALNVSAINAVGPSGITILAPQLDVVAGSDILFTVGGGNKLEVGVGQIYNSVSIIPTASGTYDMGSPTNYIATVYANNLVGANIGKGTINNATLSGTVNLASGANITSTASGTVNIGSPSAPIGTIYATSIVTSVSSGTYVNKTGDTMTGSLTLASGASILISASGVGTIGSAAAPLAAVYATSFLTPSGGAYYVAKAGDTMTGPLSLSNVNSPSGNLAISGTVNTNILAGTVLNETAQNINITSTTGPVIITAATEFQVLTAASGLALDINPSGVVTSVNIFSATSGNLNIGTPSFPFNTIYAKNIIETSPSGAGAFVHISGDTMTGNLNMVSGTKIIVPLISGSNSSLILDTSVPTYVNTLALSGNGLHYNLNANGGFLTSIDVTNDVRFHVEGVGAFSVSGINNGTGGNSSIFMDANAAYMGGPYSNGAKFSASGTIVEGASPNGLLLNSVVGGGQALISLSGTNIFMRSLNPSVSISLTPSNLVTNGTILPTLSGTDSIGSVATPFAGLYTAAVYQGTRTTSNSYTATATDTNIFTNQSSGITIGLAATAAGKEYRIISKVSSAVNTVIVSGISCTIDGAAIKTISSATIGASSYLISDGSNYFSLSNLI